MEIWKDVPGWEGLYKASNLGKIKRSYLGVAKDKILKTVILENGYQSRVTLKYKGKMLRKSPQQIIAMTFLDHDPNGHTIVVDHINGNKSDNRLENLQIITQSENVKRSIDKSKSHTGEHHIYGSGKYGERFRVVMNGKHYGLFNTLEDAIKIRNKNLKKQKL